MEDRRSETALHKITMDSRERLTATGVEDVESFAEDKIVAYTGEGQMTVKGAELKINRLSVEDGELEIEGVIDSIEYQDTHPGSGGGLWSRIFR